MGLLLRVTGFCHRNALAVVLGGLALAGLAGLWSSHRLGVSTDTDEMFAASLPWRQRQIAMDRDFPQFRDLLVAVVEGKSPEAADATAAGLVTALTQNGAGARDTALIRDVRRPDADPFLARAGLMYLDKAQLTTVLDQTIDAQPFLGQLAADPSARGLFAALALMGMGVSRGQAVLVAAAGRVAGGSGGALPFRADPAEAGFFIAFARRGSNGAGARGHRRAGECARRQRDGADHRGRGPGG